MSKKTENGSEKGIRISEMITMNNAIQEVLDDAKAKESLGTKSLYALHKNKGKLTSHIKRYDDTRQDLAEKYAKKDGKGGMKTEMREENGRQVEVPSFTDKNREKFIAETQDLLQQREEVDIHKFDLEEVEGFDKTLSGWVVDTVFTYFIKD